MFALAAFIVALIWLILDVADAGTYSWLLPLTLCLLAAHFAFSIAIPWGRRP